MIDREKVIKALKNCAAIHKSFVCESCEYQGVDCAIDDALALLKAQEPIKPYMDYDGRDVWRCGICEVNIFHPSHTQADDDEKKYRKFCRRCGRAVKWE